MQLKKNARLAGHLLRWFYIESWPLGNWPLPCFEAGRMDDCVRSLGLTTTPEKFSCQGWQQYRRAASFFFFFFFLMIRCVNVAQLAFCESNAIFLPNLIHRHRIRIYGCQFDGNIGLVTTVTPGSSDGESCCVVVFDEKKRRLFDRRHRKSVVDPPPPPAGRVSLSARRRYIKKSNNDEWEKDKQAVHFSCLIVTATFCRRRRLPPHDHLRSITMTVFLPLSLNKSIGSIEIQRRYYADVE